MEKSRGAVRKREGRAGEEKKASVLRKVIKNPLIYKKIIN